jgi:hypothetical protein
MSLPSAGKGRLKPALTGLSETVSKCGVFKRDEGECPK